MNADDDYNRSTFSSLLKLAENFLLQYFLSWWWGREIGHEYFSAACLANAGADMDSIKRHGGWKSSRVAEGHIRQSLNYKRKKESEIASGISGDKWIQKKQKIFQQKFTEEELKEERREDDFFLFSKNQWK